MKNKMTIGLVVLTLVAIAPSVFGSQGGNFNPFFSPMGKGVTGSTGSGSGRTIQIGGDSFGQQPVHICVGNFRQTREQEDNKKEIIFLAPRIEKIMQDFGDPDLVKSNLVDFLFLHDYYKKKISDETTRRFDIENKKNFLSGYRFNSDCSLNRWVIKTNTSCRLDAASQVAGEILDEYYRIVGDDDAMDLD